jgi:hypothetical protein
MSNGKYECTYNSFLEAAKDNQVPISSIQRAIKGGYRVKENYYSTELYDILYIDSQKVSLKNKKLHIYTLSGEYVTTLEGKKEICNFFNIASTGSIIVALRTKRQYKDFQLSLIYEEKLDKYIDKRNKRKVVNQYNLTGDFIKEFESITLAVKEFGTGVQKVLRGQQKQCKGFIFKYKS